MRIDVNSATIETTDYGTADLTLPSGRVVPLGMTAPLGRDISERETIDAGLSFLSAWVEAIESAHESDNDDIFDPTDTELREWATDSREHILLAMLEGEMDD